MQPVDCLQNVPLVAILRGIIPSEVVEVTTTIVKSGIKVIEVPLNSPNPLESIAVLSQNFGTTCLCGAGTVTNPKQVQQVFDIGGRLIVSPNVNTAVISKALALNMVVIPGFHTATEAFQAIDAGAEWLKFYPANSIGTAYFKDIHCLLPQPIKIIATGGIVTDNLQDWLAIGVYGAGIGSYLYHPNIAMATITERAQLLTLAYQKYINAKID